MKKLAVLILLCALLGGCAEQFQGEGQGDDSSELVSNAETTTTTTTTQSTTSTTETSTYEPIEVEIDDPLAGFVPVEYTPLYEVVNTEVEGRPEVLAEDVPTQNLEGTDADLTLVKIYDDSIDILVGLSASAGLSNIEFTTIINDTVYGINTEIISEPIILYNGYFYHYAANPICKTLSDYIDYANNYLTLDCILSLIGSQSLIEYNGILYCKDTTFDAGMGLSGKRTFYKVSETENQAIYEVYYWYDSEFTGWEDGARKRYVVLQKENGRWLVADGGFWMDLF